MEDINIIDNKKLIGLERYFNDLVKLINEKKILDGNSFDVVKRYFSLQNTKNVIKEIILSS